MDKYFNKNKALIIYFVEIFDWLTTFIFHINTETDFTDAVDRCAENNERLTTVISQAQHDELSNSDKN